MQFITKKSVLETIISAASRAVNNKSPLPALTGILLEAKGDMLTAIGSDAEITVTSSASVEVIDEGRIILPSKYFCELVKRLPSGPVSINVVDNSAIVRYGKQKATSAVMPAEEYPSIPNEEGSAVEVDTTELIASIKKTYFVCLDDITNSNLSGVYFNVTPFNIEVAATDRTRANMSFMQGEGDEGSVIVPKRCLEEVIKLFKDSKARIIIGSNLVTFICGNIKIKSRVISGRFPNLYFKLPKIVAKTNVNSSELLDTLSRASLLVNPEGYSTVDITIKDNFLTVESIGTSGTLTEQMKVEHEGESVEMTFDTRYLTETISVCGDHPTLHFMGKYTPVQVNEENFFSFLPPIKKGTKKAAV
jgi:DNA polymerase-3 subunit beta